MKSNWKTINKISFRTPKVIFYLKKNVSTLDFNFMSNEFLQCFNVCLNLTNSNSCFF